MAHIRETFECTICHELPDAPIFCCPNGHIVCLKCREKMPHCGVCRASQFNFRNILAEELMKMMIFPCQYKAEGCCHSLMTAVEFKKHIVDCPYRPIECAHCGEMIKANEYLDHHREHHKLKEAKGHYLAKCDMDNGFESTKISCFGRDFILTSTNNSTSFWTWISSVNMMPEDNFYAKVTLRVGDNTYSSEPFHTLDARLPGTEVVKIGQCLAFDFQDCSIPFFVRPNYEVRRAPCIPWGYDVEIWEGTDIKSSPTKVLLSSPETILPTESSTEEMESSEPGSSEIPESVIQEILVMAMNPAQGPHPFTTAFPISERDVEVLRSEVANRIKEMIRINSIAIAEETTQITSTTIPSQPQAPTVDGSHTSAEMLAIIAAQLEYEDVEGEESLEDQETIENLFENLNLENNFEDQNQIDVDTYINHNQLNGHYQLNGQGFQNYVPIVMRMEPNVVQPFGISQNAFMMDAFEISSQGEERLVIEKDSDEEIAEKRQKMDENEANSSENNELGSMA